MTGLSDFDGDAKADLFWRNVSTTDLSLWTMNGISAPGINPIVLPSGIVPPPVNWKVQAIGDFGLDGKADVVWRNQTSGASTLWTMNGATRVSSALLAAEGDLMWAVRGAADFDGDGAVDVLWRHETLEGLRLWLAGTTSATFALTPGLLWTLQGLGDLDGDGKADIVWRHAISARVVGWLMNGTTRTAGGFLPDPTLTQNLVGVGDLNGDGKDDLLWRDELSGAIELWTMNGLSVVSVGNVGTLNSGWVLQRVGDFDGDGKSDLLWRNAISGNLVVWLMDGATKLAGASVGVQADANWQIQGGFNWSFGALGAPALAPADGTYFVGQLSVSSSAASGATIRYTTDGSEPTSVAPRYTGSFPLVGTTTVKAKAFRQGWSDSPTASATYYRQAATPAIDPPSGTYTNQVLVQLTGESGTELRYAVGYGTTPPEPTSTSALYSLPIWLDRGATLKVKAFRPGWVASATASATYGITLGAPTLSPGSGTYAWDTQIQVTPPVPDAVLRYTLNGVDPLASDPQVSSGRLRNPGTTLKVRAFKAGCTASPVTTATYGYSGGGRGEVLLVSDNWDAAAAARLRTLGFTVTVKNGAEVVRADAGGKGLVLISSSVNPADVNTKFYDVTTPVMLWEAKLYDDMGMTGPTAGTHYEYLANQTEVTLAATTHPVMAGLTGTRTIYSSPSSVAWGVPAQPVGIPAAGGLTLATAANGQAALFTYEQGAELYDATRAAGRRVGFPGVPGLTNDGWALFDAAVNWAASREKPVLYLSGPSVPNGADRLMMSAMVGWYGLPLRWRSIASSGVPTANQVVQSGYSMVVVSSTVVGADVGAAFRNLALPVVTWEHEIYPHMGMTGSVVDFHYGVTAGQTNLTIVAPTHPIAGGLAGTVVATNAAMPFTYGAQFNANWAVMTVATLSDGTAGVFAYERGTQMRGLLAPGRRVGLFLGDDTADFHLYFPGFHLAGSAMRWARADVDRDNDGDGLTELEEARLGTDPNDADTNDDGIPDGLSVQLGISPTNLDHDGDGLTNGVELQRGTDPFRADTDGDGCLDGVDLFPLDPSRCQLPPDPTPSVAPRITLTEPVSAVLVSCVPATPCP